MEKENDRGKMVDYVWSEDMGSIPISKNKLSQEEWEYYYLSDPRINNDVEEE